MEYNLKDIFLHWLVAVILFPEGNLLLPCIIGTRITATDGWDEMRGMGNQNNTDINIPTLLQLGSNLKVKILVSETLWQEFHRLWLQWHQYCFLICDSQVFFLHQFLNPRWIHGVELVEARAKNRTSLSICHGITLNLILSSMTVMRELTYKCHSGLL